MTTTDGSRSISSYIACLMASRNVTCVGASFFPPFAPAFVAGAVEVFAMGYLRPFFAASLTAGFFAGFDLAADFAGAFAVAFAGPPIAVPTTGAATFAIFFR